MRILRIAILTLLGLSMMMFQAAAKIPDPYKVLGLQKSATQDQIKQGFKRRSKRYHPDRNKEDPKAKDKFQKVVNAYQLLKDPQRKRIYDATGEDNPNMGDGGFGGGGGFGGFSDFGINIEDLMRGFGGGGGRGGGQRGGGGGYSFSFSTGGGRQQHFQF